MKLPYRCYTCLGIVQYIYIVDRGALGWVFFVRSFFFFCVYVYRLRLRLPLPPPLQLQLQLRAVRHRTVTACPALGRVEMQNRFDTVARLAATTATAATFTAAAATAATAAAAAAANAAANAA